MLQHVVGVFTSSGFARNLMKLFKRKNGRRLYPTYNPVTRAFGKRFAGLSGAALGYITNSLPGAVAGYNLGYRAYKRRWPQRFHRRTLSSNRLGGRVSIVNPPNYGSNPGHRFGSNPNPNPTKPRKSYGGMIRVGGYGHRHRFRRLK